LTRSLSTIAEVGYESLSDPNVPPANGQGITWSGGGRYRPNSDSSILLLYGRHDLKTDVAGEIQWRLTPLTTLFAAYTDSLTTSQQTLLGNNQASLPGEDGPALGVTFEDDPLIAILDDPSLGPNREQRNGAAAGVPLLDADNFTLHQNGIFRSKLFRTSLTSDLADGSTVTVTLFHSERTALTLQSRRPQLTNEGIRATWAPVITEDITGRVEAGARSDEITHGKTYNIAFAAEYHFSPTFNGGLRYDFLVHENGTGSQGSSYTNALTLTLRKSFLAGPMYAEFYSLTSMPFQLTPDSRFFFGSSEHNKAMAFLNYGISQGEGFVVVTGEVGAGKTTLVDHLLATLDPTKYITGRIVTTQLNSYDMLRMVGAAFQIFREGMDKASLVTRIKQLLDELTAQRKRALLIVDEAQSLTTEALEELRMLSNLIVSGGSPLQSILLGQPEFRAVLSSPDLEQLRQRVTASCHLGALNEVDTRRYIEHRLK